jgi:hypothetical protein
MYKDIIQKNISEAKSEYERICKLIDVMTEVGIDVSEYIPKVARIKEDIDRWEKVLERID